MGFSVLTSKRFEKLAFAIIMLSAVLMTIGTAMPRASASSGAKADFNNDGYADVAVGVSREEAGVSSSSSINNDNPGTVNVIHGSAAGLSVTTIADQFGTQDSPNVQDVAEIGDMFGTALR